MRVAVKQVQDYMLDMGAVFNDDKTNYLVFQKSLRSLSKDFKIDFEVVGHKIESKKRVKMLGRIIADNLSPDNHLNKIKGEIYGNLGLIRNIMVHGPPSKLILTSNGITMGKLCHALTTFPRLRHPPYS